MCWHHCWITGGNRRDCQENGCKSQEKHSNKMGDNSGSASQSEHPSERRERAKSGHQTRQEPCDEHPMLGMVSMLWVLWRCVHPRNDHVTLRPKRSSPMDRYRAPPISGSWSRGAARAVDGALLLHGPLRVDRNAETEKKVSGWTEHAWTQHQGTMLWNPAVAPTVQRMTVKINLLEPDTCSTCDRKRVVESTMCKKLCKWSKTESSWFSDAM